MLKKLVSISLIFCILASMLGFAIPLSWYLSNYTHITTNLCINRHNPNVECNGVCQLKKRMNQDDEHDHSDENKATTIDRHHRVDLFVSQYSGVLVHPSPTKNDIISSDQIAVSLWIDEPLSPPPQLG